MIYLKEFKNPLLEPLHPLGYTPNYRSNIILLLKFNYLFFELKFKFMLVNLHEKTFCKKINLNVKWVQISKKKLKGHYM